MASRNVINRALGVESGVEVEIKSIHARDGARFLLCSDGIYRHLSDEEIARVLSEHKDPQRAADELKRIVHKRGADDNLTAVVVQMGRARQTPIIAIDDGMPTGPDKRTSGAQRAGASAVSRVPASAGRIQVEFNPKRPELGESTRRLERQSRMETTEPYARKSGRSVSRVVMYTLPGLVLIAGAFYGGLRASVALFLKNRSLHSREATTRRLLQNLNPC